MELKTTPLRESWVVAVEIAMAVARAENCRASLGAEIGAEIGWLGFDTQTIGFRESFGSSRRARHKEQWHIVMLSVHQPAARVDGNR